MTDEEVPPHMKTRTLPDDFGVLCIAIRKPLATYLWSLQHTGLYGIDIAETVDRALCDTINREVLRGFIPGLRFNKDGLVTSTDPLRGSRTHSPDKAREDGNNA